MKKNCCKRVLTFLEGWRVSQRSEHRQVEVLSSQVSHMKMFSCSHCSDTQTHSQTAAV